MKLPSNTLNAGLSLLVVLSTFFLPGAMFAEEGATGRAPLILDMVHHNVGCDPYESAYNDPAVIKKMGFNGKVYYLFDSPTDLLPVFGPLEVRGSELFYHR